MVALIGTHYYSDADSTLLPADKGNVTVVMDRCDYEMTDTLADGTYKKLKRDPTTKIETKVKNALKGLERRGLIDDRTRTRLTPQHSTPPQMYGLPKIHKEGTPLRPIVSTIGSPTYCLAKELTRILTPLVGNTSSNVKNSAEFSEMIRKMELDEKDRMVSFDVVSLFTRIDVDEALEILSSLLLSDDNLEDRTTIPAADICHLTALCLKSTYFCYRDEFFEQTQGAAMGSPLSPVMANIFMESFE